MNRIKQTMQKKGRLLSIYFTAGFPKLEDTIPIITSLAENGVDMIEIGLPFSDPLADGPTIQASSTRALQNGMTSDKLFEQLAGIRNSVSVPLLIMGYFNPILQYGVEAFCRQCAETGIDGLIIPDLPLEEYQLHYQSIFEKYHLANIFLITPQPSETRIREIGAASDGFIYMVSSASTTGARKGFGDAHIEYFERITSMQLKTPRVIGFGINDKESFDMATDHAKGAIIGSAFIKEIGEKGTEGIPDFVKRIRYI